MICMGKMVPQGQKPKIIIANAMSNRTLCQIDFVYLTFTAVGLST